MRVVSGLLQILEEPCRLVVGWIAGDVVGPLNDKVDPVPLDRVRNNILWNIVRAERTLVRVLVLTQRTLTEIT
jgi:hypothetical protein